MMIFMFIALLVGQMGIEYKIAHALGLKELSMKFVGLNLVFSLGISLAMAHLFPAAGMLILASGICSTFLSRPMYVGADHYNKDVKPQLDKGKGWLTDHREEIEQAAYDLGRMLCIVVKVVTSPFVAARWTMHKYDAAKEKVDNVRHHHTA